MWNGNGGRTIFFQNEMPYDPPNQAACMNGAHQRLRRLQGRRHGHHPRGAGAWAATATSTSTRRSMRDHGFEVPNNAGVKFHSMLTVSLGRQRQSSTTSSTPPADRPRARRPSRATSSATRNAGSPPTEKRPGVLSSRMHARPLHILSGLHFPERSTLVAGKAHGAAVCALGTQGDEQRRQRPM